MSSLLAIPRAVPDLPAFLAVLRAQATHRSSTIHGEQHWQAVARTGTWLLDAGVHCDPAVLFCFAALHDHRRVNDGSDLEHGPRAAANLPAFRDVLVLTEERWDRLTRACRDHTTVIHTDDPTIGASFDADRLNLMRVGKVPDPARLNHPASREPAMIARCSAAVFEPDDWERLRLAG